MSHKSWTRPTTWFKKDRTFSINDLPASDKEALVQLSIKERSYIENRPGVTVKKVSDWTSYLEAGSKNVWATFRACHLVANVVMSATFKLTEQSKDGGPGTDVMLAQGLPPLSFLTSPNPQDSFDEMVYQWVYHMKLTGNAFWLKDEMNGKGQPVALYPLLPQFMEILPDKKTKVKHYLYKVNGETLTIPVEQMIHFRRPHPMEFLTGMGDVAPSESLFNSYMTRNLLEEKFLQNGASPSGLLTRKEPVHDEDEWIALKKKWDLTYGGKANAGKTAFLNGEWNYIKMGLTMAEMEALEKEKWTVQQIFLNHGVPLSVAGLEKAANYATARIDDMAFRKNECVPLINLLVGKLNAANGLIPAFNPLWKIDYNLSGLIDVEQVMKDYAPMVRLGAMTPNELRVMAGLSKVDNPFSDQFFVEQNLIPIEAAGLQGTTQADINDVTSGT